MDWIHTERDTIENIDEKSEKRLQMRFSNSLRRWMNEHMSSKTTKP